ncbi:MAG: hypothetical protein J6P75_01605 [Bacteroidales bacterium]|nr:hypothetical protein [Bacteroidales bacterium]
MPARLLILTLLLSVGCLTAYGQDLRTGVPTADGGFLAAGDYLAWLDEEGSVLRKRPLSRPLTALAICGDRLFALEASGRDLVVLDSDGAIVSREKLPVKGRLRALAADSNTLWAVTDAGEIAHRTGDTAWSVFDFNAQYAGYYPSMEFRAVAAGGGSVMVAGIGPDGAPAAFTSARGTVWSERVLDYTEQGLSCVFSAKPASLSYDAPQDRFYLVGSGGAQLALPGCSHCNSLIRYPVETLFARIAGSTKNLLLGSDGFQRVEER